MHENKEIQERVILVGVSEQEGDDAQDSLTELAQLVETAGAAVEGTVLQKLARRHPATYVGSGKVQEIKELLILTDATGIVCDDELSPAQMRNLADLLDTKVMDRTLVILDIFAKRAATSEGKIQVELAQLRYEMTRLTGFGRSMSRLGGGIGTRGPGEKKLETDRRIIAGRISQLKRELGGGEAAPGGQPQPPHPGKPAGGGDRRLYQRGKIHTLKCAHGCGCAGMGRAVCHP